MKEYRIIDADDGRQVIGYQIKEKYELLAKRGTYQEMYGNELR